MTNEELQKHNAEHLKVHCRGDRVIPLDIVTQLHEMRRKYIAEGNVAAMRTLGESLDATLGTRYTPTEDALDLLNTAALWAIDHRKGCGADLSTLVGSPPYDGVSKAAPCPSCGVEITWTSATSDEEAAKREEQLLAKLTEIVGP